MKASVFWLCYILTHAHSITLDSNYPNKKITKLAFGSCSKQKYSLDYLQNIINVAPDIWLWTGDIVYGKTKHGTDLTNVRQNYQTLKSHPLHQQLISNNVIIEGIYDDHNIGCNDADNRLSKTIQKEAQELLLDYLNIPQNDARRKRNGVYSVHKYDDILIILLDTRTHRSPTVIPGIGRYEYTAVPLMASYIRYLSAMLGLVDTYNGTILGEEQWLWLEQILESNAFKNSKLVLIISSTQIFTRNPYFESWGHFPSEKKRFVKLLYDAVNDTQQHILFVSGDVHHAELLYGNEEYGPLEVTSSGLTHTINTMKRIKDKLAMYMVQLYAPYHRTQYSIHDVLTAYYGRNFGVIEVMDDNEYRLNIHDATSGDKVISVSLNSNKLSSFKDVLEQMQDDNYLYFPRIFAFYGVEIIGLMIVGFLCILILYLVLCRCMSSCKSDYQEKHKKE